MIRTHLYWGYKLSRAEELLKVTAVCPTVCNLSYLPQTALGTGSYMLNGQPSGGS